ncbi:hypothetical protein [Psychroflexus sp. MES1-P1E]|uniref:hypothetical protein n=1 Tax=Psychroflexus sp. MES1-P1E TaxID=2058320 RepID=UPI000C7D3139|nr:hypothetical protein [Psychroflexus sp. MES1-P1E]PKG44054.1 hypothetical protein CXF67_01705 [Psychroflexus sp. MES1-P1E]
METTNNNPLHKRQYKDKALILDFIRKQVEKGTGRSLTELKKEHSEERLFYIGLKHTTTTKKAFCKALNINIDNACRYKRALELDGNLVQSKDEIICPYTKHKAHLISTNSKEFERLQKSKTNQLKMFV